jgi:thioesterase domain-containing protein
MDDLLLDFSFPDFARRVWRKLASISRSATALCRRKSDWRRFEVDGFVDTSAFSDDQAGFMRSLYASLFQYVPRPYAGRVLVYMATTQPLYHLLGFEELWRQLAPEMEVVPVRGTHISIVVEPYVRAIADDLRVRLSKLRTSPSGHSCRPLTAPSCDWPAAEVARPDGGAGEDPPNTVGAVASAN